MVADLHERVNLGIGWQELLCDEFKHSYMQELANFVARERAGTLPVYPLAHLVFNAFVQTPRERVKVVIVGQDPYHGPGQAHGLCFSVLPGVAIPPSLRNIYQELHADLGYAPPSHGSLLSWAKQGVLLLNATLTVRQGAPKSHYGRGWERFTDAALATLVNQKVVFLLWGRSAREKVERVLSHTSGGQPKILATHHPSPLSAHRGFFGCRHFSRANALLEEMGVDPIDWEIR